MKEQMLQKYSIFELKRYLAELERKDGREAVEKLVGKEKADEIDREFEMKIALRVEPYWKDIQAYERGNWFARKWVQIKYQLLDKHGDCNVPRSVLEAIVDTMMPDIRAFFESEEGQREFEEWKRERELKQAEKEKNSSASKKKVG